MFAPIRRITGYKCSLTLVCCIGKLSQLTIFQLLKSFLIKQSSLDLHSTVSPLYPWVPHLQIQPTTD